GIETPRGPPISTIAKTRAPSKPAGSPASWTVNAWIVPRLDRSAQSNRSEPHSPQNPRGGHDRRPPAAQRVVARRPDARHVYHSWRLAWSADSSGNGSVARK